MSGERDRAPRVETAVAARNFTLTTAERVRAIVAGPPAWVMRRRRIEDLEEMLVNEVLAVAEARGVWPTALSPAMERRLAEINRLVEAHNRYYPIEADLPLDPRSGRTMDRGAPWRPMPARTAEELIDRARSLRATG